MTDSSLPLISVVIPSRNQGRYIEQTLLSVLGQQYPNLEILVMDGGSADNTLEILRKYQGRIFWRSHPDKGQAEAINEGIERSRGDIVCWLSSDDLYLPGALLDVAERFKGHLHEPYLVYGSALTLREESGWLEGGWKYAAKPDPAALTYECTMIQPAVFWTRHAWRAVGPINERYDHVIDWEWYVRASKVVPFEHVLKFYSIFRHHALQKSKLGLERRLEVLEVVEKYATEDWKRIYRLIHGHFDQIQARLRFFKDKKSPAAYTAFCFFFPWLACQIKSRRNAGIVLGMLDQ